jgi:hypothetical protein
MTAPWDGVRSILGKSELDELEVHHSRLFSVGVPIRADPEFKAFVFAAAAAHAFGNKWIDGVCAASETTWYANSRRHPRPATTV